MGGSKKIRTRWSRFKLMEWASRSNRVAKHLLRKKPNLVRNARLLIIIF